MIEVKDTDENGETLLQLPQASQNDANFRDELRKPIDKYDWLSFNKISRPVFFPESERFLHRKHGANISAFPKHFRCLIKF